MPSAVPGAGAIGGRRQRTNLGAALAPSHVYANIAQRIDVSGSRTTWRLPATGIANDGAIGKRSWTVGVWTGAHSPSFANPVAPGGKPVDLAGIGAGLGVPVVAKHQRLANDRLLVPVRPVGNGPVFPLIR